MLHYIHTSFTDCETFWTQSSSFILSANSLALSVICFISSSPLVNIDENVFIRLSPYAKFPMNSNNPVNLPPLPPRVQQCWNNIQMGFKMGAAVGGCFGFLAGGYSAFANRSFWLFPLGIVGGAASFGFFLGCGMIIRCEEKYQSMRMVRI